MAGAAAPDTSDTAFASAASVAACSAPLKSEASTPVSVMARFTMGRGEGVAEFGSGARKDAVEVLEAVAVPEAELVAVHDWLGVLVDVEDAVAVEVRVVEPVAVADEVADPVALAVAELVEVGLSDELADGDTVGDALALADEVGMGEQAGATPPAQYQLPSAALLASVAEAPSVSAAQLKE